MKMRKPTLHERRIVLAIANLLVEKDRQQLLADLSDSTITNETADGSRRVFHIPGYQRPLYRGQHSYNVEGTMKDADGADVTVRLYADENNRLFELEFIRWGDGDLIAPRWTTLELC